MWVGEEKKEATRKLCKKITPGGTRENGRGEPEGRDGALEGRSTRPTK